MDVLLPVFIAVLLAETGGRAQDIAHRLTLSGTPPRVIWTALGIATLGSYVTAAVAGAFVATLINFQARSLLAGLALLLAGGPMLFFFKRKEIAADSASLLKAVIRFVTAQFGDAAQFIVFAMAARNDMPFLALFAGLWAVAASAAPPILLGTEWPGAIPLRLLRILGGVLLIGAGGWLITSTLQLT
jgi:Ca2+/H+ antiporter, TMEM165/GDT1 family